MFKALVFCAIIVFAFAQLNNEIDNSLLEENVVPGEDFPEEETKILPTSIDIDKFRESFATKNVRERFLPSK
ncbi:unnamed protein product [Auanema sp. JU1783]|nr:unnamed protein product [Auanema sp. JU1783]